MGRRGMSEKKRDLLQRKESAYWNSQIIANQCSSKKSWKLLNNLMMRDRTNASSPPVTITAETLSRFFQDKVGSVRDSTAGAKEPTFVTNNCQIVTDFSTLTPADIRDVILESPPKSCSLDPIPTFLLREFLDDLLPFIWFMCTTSLQSGHLPMSQKTAIVTPILKKTGLDPNDVKSYRPVSNLTFMYKIVERLVSRQVTEHLHRNGLMPTVQSAYRHGYSTETALLKIVSDITDATDAGKVSLLAMLDMSSAFDTVDFDILLKRLETSYGISGTVSR